MKRELFLSRGVPEYWVVNAAARIVSRWRTLDDPGEGFTGRMNRHPTGLPEALAIDLPDLFEDALG